MRKRDQCGHDEDRASVKFSGGLLNSEDFLAACGMQTLRNLLHVYRFIVKNECL